MVSMYELFDPSLQVKNELTAGVWLGCNVSFTEMRAEVSILLHSEGGGTQRTQGAGADLVCCYDHYFGCALPLEDKIRPPAKPIRVRTFFKDSGCPVVTYGGGCATRLVNTFKFIGEMGGLCAASLPDGS